MTTAIIMLIIIERERGIDIIKYTVDEIKRY